MKEMADATPKSQAILPFTLPPPGLGVREEWGPWSLHSPLHYNPGGFTS